MIAKNYTQLLHEIAQIATSCGRNPQAVKLLVVSKGHAWVTMQEAYRAGCRNFGESRLQEVMEKIPLAPENVGWHLIGSLQRNKVRKAVGRFVLIHSVDTPELAQKIDTVSKEEGLTTRVLLQVNTSGETTKHGLTGTEWRVVFKEIFQLQNLDICGLMTMGPNVEDEGLIRSAFRQLRELRDELSSDVQCELPELSMGMSHDYRIAIEEGATWVRVGTRIFG